MSLKTPVPRMRPITVTGLGAGWSNPKRFSQMGEAGGILLVHFRGDVGDATTGTAEMMIFRAAAPTDQADYVTFPDVVTLANLDPDAVTRADKFLEMTGITIAPHATDPSDESNLKLALGDEGATFDRQRGTDIWVAIKGVTGDVHIGIDSKGH